MDFCRSAAEQCNFGVQPRSLCPEVHKDGSTKEVVSSFLTVQIFCVGMKSLLSIEDSCSNADFLSSYAFEVWGANFHFLFCCS